jgi:hypothetical protein
VLESPDQKPRSCGSVPAQSSSGAGGSAPAKLNQLILSQIDQLLAGAEISQQALEEFAFYVIANHRKKDPKPAKSPKPAKPAKPKALTAAQLKEAVCNYFRVIGKPTAVNLRKCAKFQMETEGMNLPSMTGNEGWKTLYRKFVDFLPGEEWQDGYGCINGVNIFQYFRPWRVLELDPASATQQQKKDSYYRLSRIYHPDNGETGDAKIFDLIKNMYDSISAEP